MVTRHFFRPIFLPALTISTLALPSPAVHAQNVLQQIEAEVSAIATKTRAAVVTIQDAPESRLMGSRTNATGTFMQPTVGALNSVYPTLSITTTYLKAAELQGELKRKMLDLGQIQDQLTTQDPLASPSETGELKTRLERAKGEIARTQQELAQKQQELKKQRLQGESQMSALKKQMETLKQEMKRLEGDLKKQKNSGQKQELERRLSTLQLEYQTKNLFDFKASQIIPNINTNFAWADAYRSTRSGTGFSIGDGFIVTTADVLGGMRNPTVTTSDGKKYSGTIVSVYEDLNLGLIKLNDATNLPALSLGDSDGATIGHFAIPVGNLGGQANSAALLMIGAINESGLSSGSRYYPRLIQIAGTVGEGTSGAPLVDSKGEVIGMMVAVPVQSSPANTIYVTPGNQQPLGGRTGEGGVPTLDWNTLSDDLPAVAVVGEGEPPHPQTPTVPAVPNVKADLGIPPQSLQPTYSFQRPAYAFSSTSPAVTSAGFAVPINLLKSVIADIKAGKKVVRGWIGISPNEITRTSDRGGGLSFTESYVTVELVYPNSPASAAGLRIGDILIEIDGKKITHAAEVREVSLNRRPGDRLRFLIERPGKTEGKRETLELTLTIQAKPMVSAKPDELGFSEIVRPTGSAIQSGAETRKP